MPLLWDYDQEDLKKSKSPWAKIIPLERQINYGVFGKEKINLSEVKKYWNKLRIEPKRKRLFEYLIWGR